IAWNAVGKKGCAPPSATPRATSACDEAQREGRPCARIRPSASRPITVALRRDDQFVTRGLSRRVPCDSVARAVYTRLSFLERRGRSGGVGLQARCLRWLLSFT